MSVPRYPWLTPPSIKKLLHDDDPAKQRKGLHRVVTELVPKLQNTARKWERNVEKICDILQELSLRVLDGRIRLAEPGGSVTATLIVRGKSITWEESKRNRRRQKFVAALQLYFDDLFATNELATAEARDAALIHEHCVADLRQRYERDGKLALFEALEPFLICKRPYSGAELARRVGIKVGTVNTAKLRLREQYAETMCKELIRLGHLEEVPGLEARLKSARR